MQRHVRTYYTCVHVDNDVSVNAAILEVYLLQQCNVVNAYACKLLCAELHTSRNTRSANNFGISNFVFPHFCLVCVRIKYTSNMAGCYDNNVNDVTAPHVYAGTMYGMTTTPLSTVAADATL